MSKSMSTAAVISSLLEPRSRRARSKVNLWTDHETTRWLGGAAVHRFLHLYQLGCLLFTVVYCSHCQAKDFGSKVGAGAMRHGTSWLTSTTVDGEEGKGSEARSLLLRLEGRFNEFAQCYALHIAGCVGLPAILSMDDGHYLIRVLFDVAVAIRAWACSVCNLAYLCRAGDLIMQPRPPASGGPTNIGFSLGR